MNYPRAIKICRAAREIEQRELANLLGVSASYMSLIESGNRKVGKSLLAKICDALDVPEDLMRLLAAEQNDVKRGKSAAEMNALAHSLLALVVTN